MKILLSDSAFADLEVIKKYYSDEGVPQVGDEYVADIIAHIETITGNPDICRKVPEFNEANIRELIHAPFRIVYLREENVIHVVRIWRSERLLNLSGTPANIEK